MEFFCDSLLTQPLLPTLNPKPPRLSATANCPTSGGTLLTIYGRYLDSGVSVEVAGARCENVALGPVNDSITCTLPEGSGMDQLVQIKTLFTSLTSLPFAGVSYAPPVVTGVTSVSGCSTDKTGKVVDCTRAGYSVIELTGSNFGKSGAIILIGGVRCNKSDHVAGSEHTTMRCTMPAGSGLDRSILLIQVGKHTHTRTIAFACAGNVLPALSGKRTHCACMWFFPFSF